MKSVVIIDHTPYVVRSNLSQIARITKLGKRVRTKLQTLGYRGGTWYRVYPTRGKEDELRRAIYFYISRPYYTARKPWVTIPKEVNNDFWNNLIDWYHPDGKATLISCIREFRDTQSEYREIINSRGSCHGVSRDFETLLRMRRVIGPNTIHSNTQVRWRTFSSSPDFGDLGHADFRIGRVVIDWTAVQFGYKQFPRIYLDKEEPAPTCKLP